MQTRVITKGDEYPRQLLAKKLLLVTEYQPEVTYADFIKRQLTTGKSFNCITKSKYAHIHSIRKY